MQGTRVRPWVGKIPWRREWQPTPVFLPVKSQEQRSLQSMGLQRVEQQTAIYCITLEYYTVKIYGGAFLVSVFLSFLYPVSPAINW